MKSPSRSILALPLFALIASGPLGCGNNQPDSDFKPWVIEDLQGEQGFSLRVPEFEVPAGHESQNCYFV
ncbi:MAG: hypothetical protein ABIY55_06600, partial [Kofleriaceae bacterium]